METPAVSAREVAPETTNPGSWRIRAAGLVLVGAALTGCGLDLHPSGDKELEGGPFPTLPAATLDTAEPSLAPLPDLPVQRDYEDLANGPCWKDAYRRTPAKERAEAARCRRSHHGGRIALVNYDLPAATASTIAQGIQIGLAKASDGKLTQRVTVVQASANAKRLLDPTCIDSTQPETWGSVIADETQKIEADFVLGLSSMPSCGDVAGGAADKAFATNSSPHSRHADIFAGDLRGEPEHSDWSQGDVSNIVKAGIHESAHNDLLGHAGLYKARAADNTLQRLDTTDTINLPRTLARGNYTEYAKDDPDPMSSNYTATDIHFNAIHQQQLQQGTADITMPGVSRRPRIYDYADTLQDQFVTFALAKPVALTDPTVASATQGAAHTFNRVALVPNGDDRTETVFAVTPTLYDNEGNTASLGDVILANHPDGLTLQTGRQNIVITAENDGDVELRVT